MSRICTLSLVLAATVAAQAHAGGIVCWMAELEKKGEVDAYAAELRAKGPAGLDEAIKILDGLNDQMRVKKERIEIGKDDSDVEWSEKEQLARKAINRLIEQVAGQRDAHISRLYWYTEIDEARKAAVDSGKPILSLRMLGRLTDEYSCANSRFFRTALYSNKEISDYLRDNYVLLWQSVRPVPRVTVDFGDGRKLERTVTGNSAHYVLDFEGRPLDVLPGLYAPEAFANWLRRTHNLERRLAKAAEDQRGDLLASYHGERLDALNKSLRSDLAVHAPELLMDKNAAQRTVALEQLQPTAKQASFRAEAKSAAEFPLVAPFVPANDALQGQDDELWRRIAATRVDGAKLDDASLALMRAENPSAAEAGFRAVSKGRIEDPIVRLLRNFEEAMALDTVKNEYLLHRQIHQWYLDGVAPADVDALNERVYAELFLTPSSDPWLGLVPANVYTALDDGGVRAAE